MLNHQQTSRTLDHHDRLNDLLRPEVPASLSAVVAEENGAPESSRPLSLATLPDDVLLLILLFDFTPDHLLALGQTCRRLRYLSFQESVWTRALRLSSFNLPTLHPPELRLPRDDPLWTFETNERNVVVREEPWRTSLPHRSAPAHPRERYLAAQRVQRGLGKKQVVVRDVGLRLELGIIPHLENVPPITMTPGGEVFVVLLVQSMHIWDLRTGLSHHTRLEQPYGGVTASLFSYRDEEGVLLVMPLRDRLSIEVGFLPLLHGAESSACCLTTIASIRAPDAAKFGEIKQSGHFFFVAVVDQGSDSTDVYVYDLARGRSFVVDQLSDMTHTAQMVVYNGRYLVFKTAIYAVYCCDMDAPNADLPAHDVDSSTVPNLRRLPKTTIMGSLGPNFPGLFIIPSHAPSDLLRLPTWRLERPEQPRAQITAICTYDFPHPAAVLEARASGSPRASGWASILFDFAFMERAPFGPKSLPYDDTSSFGAGLNALGVPSYPRTPRTAHRCIADSERILSSIQCDGLGVRGLAITEWDPAGGKGYGELVHKALFVRDEASGRQRLLQCQERDRMDFVWSENAGKVGTCVRHKNGYTIRLYTL